MQVDWSPEESVEELLVLLKERDLSSICLLAAATKNVAEVAFTRAIEGQIVELAVLLLVAADKIVPVPVPVSTKSKRRTIYESVVEEAMTLFQLVKMTRTDGFIQRRLFLREIELIQMFGAVVPSAGNYCKNRKVLPPLLQALQIGDEPVVKLLLQAGADISETDADGNSALHLCLKAGSISQKLRLINLLLKHGARISKWNRLGLAPVHLAAAWGNYQALEILLLQSPECVDIASETQETPLFFAVRNGFLDCTKLLLHYGANSQVFNLRQQRPIDLASSQEMQFILSPVNQRFAIQQSYQKDPEDQPVISLSEQSLPPWVVKFREWLPVFLGETLKLLGNGEGYPLSSLKADFRATCRMELDHMSLGFPKLSDFIRAFPGLCKMKLMPAGNGLTSHMVLFPLNDRPHSEPFYSVHSRLKSRGVNDMEHPLLERKKEGVGGSIPPSPGHGQGARGVVQQTCFSFFERQWDYSMLSKGFCTFCFSHPGSFAIVPCSHKVCKRCFKNNARMTCTICGAKVQGFLFLGDASLQNPALSNFDYPPLGMSRIRFSHSQYAMASATTSHGGSSY